MRMRNVEMIYLVLQKVNGSVKWKRFYLALTDTPSWLRNVEMICLGLLFFFCVCVCFTDSTWYSKIETVLPSINYQIS